MKWSEPIKHAILSKRVCDREIACLHIQTASVAYSGNFILNRTSKFEKGDFFSYIGKHIVILSFCNQLAHNKLAGAYTSKESIFHTWESGAQSQDVIACNKSHGKELVGCFIFSFDVLSQDMGKYWYLGDI